MKPETKLRSIRLTEEEFASVKHYVKSLRDGIDMSTKTIIKEVVKEIKSNSKVPDSSLLHNTTVNEQQFLETGLKWFRAMTSLVSIGALGEVPELFKMPKPIQANQIVQSIDLEWLEEILSGGRFPETSEMDKHQQKVIEDGRFRALYQVYVAKPTAELKERLIELGRTILSE